MARVEYWSALKGVAILAVLLIHLPLTNNSDAVIAIRQVINFPVAIFLFLSGLFVKSDTPFLDGIKRVLYPYLIWTCFWAIITPPQSFKVLIFKICFGQFSILYFLCVLLQLKMITPLLLKHISTYKSLFNLKDWVLWITPLYLLFYSFLKLSHGELAQLLPLGSLFPAWLLFYYIGLLLRCVELRVSPMVLLLCLLLCLLVELLVSFKIAVLIDIANFALTQAKLTSMFYALCFCLLIYSLKDEAMPRSFLSWLGERSFGIYLLHMPIKYILDKLTESYGGIWGYVYDNLYLRFLIVFSLTLFVQSILIKVLPLKYSRIAGLL